MNTFGSPWASPPRLENISDDGIPMDSLGELQDSNFEPQTRARSNTWPLPRPENFEDHTEEPGSTKASNQQLSAGNYKISSENLINSIILPTKIHARVLYAQSSSKLDVFYSKSYANRMGKKCTIANWRTHVLLEYFTWSFEEFCIESPFIRFSWAWLFMNFRIQ